MSSIKGFALINGQRIEVNAEGDDAKVVAAMRAFGEQLGAALAKNVTVREVKPKGKVKKR